MEDEKKARKKRRRELRAIGNEEDLGDIRNDFFAEFVRKRFPGEEDAHYIREWAERFKEGAEWYRGDEKSEAILLDIMLEGPTDGMAPFIASEKVRDAIDKEKLNKIIGE